MRRMVIVSLIAWGVLFASAYSFGWQERVHAQTQVANGDWIADQRTKCRVWNSSPKPPNESVIWSGACENGLAQGRGTLEWFRDDKSVEVDQGEWRDGKRNGHGIYMCVSLAPVSRRLG